MKIPYSFTVLRYVHDVLSGEFINVGVVLFAPSAKFLDARCTAKYGRLSKMFSDVNKDHFRKSARFIQDRMEEEGRRLRDELQLEKVPGGIKEVAAKVLPVDDSSLQFSPEGYGLTDDPQKTLDQIYSRYVEKYHEKVERQRRTEDDVWRTFKKPLEEKKVLEHLKPHIIASKDYELEFKHCRKNDVWHAYQPISFDLQDADEIVEKAARWVGRMMSIDDSMFKELAQ
ncbi:MAG TPA: hypothetical protein DD725_05700 [Deltaproteobacteria bacterium]|nr:hypothetical protein [Deltaproteobacteria bacterium]